MTIRSEITCLQDDECTGWCIFAATAEEKGLAGAFVGGGIGVVTGMIIAWTNPKERLKINGDQNIFEKNVPVMRKYAVVTNTQ